MGGLISLRLIVFDLLSWWLENAFALIVTTLDAIFVYLGYCLIPLFN